MPELPQPCLALVTDRSLCPPGNSLPDQVARAVDGGVDLVQLREKDLSGGALLALAQEVREAIGDRALLLVNDRLDVALACEADGVQLGEEGLPLEVARGLGGPDLLLGRSVHSVAGAVEAEADGADFLVVGSIFPSASHPEAQPAGLGLLEQVHRAVGIPYLAIGGITVERVAEVMQAGASGVAVIRAIQGAQEPAKAAEGLRRAMLAAWSQQKEVGRRA